MTRKSLFVGILMMVVIVLPGFSKELKKELDKSKSINEACEVIRSIIGERTKPGLFGGTDEEELRDELKTTDSSGRYPIFYPVYNNDVDLTRMVLKYMGSIDTLYAPDKKSLLQIAAADDGDRTAMIELFLYHKDKPSREYLDYSCKNDGWTALNIAVSRGNKKIAELLLKHGASPNIVENDTNTTPLIQVIDCSTKYKSLDDRFAMVKSLVEYHANVNYEWKPEGTGTSRTPLFLSVTHDYRNITKFLLEKAAVVNTENKYSEDGLMCSATALDYAFNKGMSAIAKILLAQPNINVNSEFKSQQGNNTVTKVSPLFQAVINSSEDDIKLLLEKGADINNATNIYMYDMAKGFRLYDASALNYACFSGMNEIADLLMEKGADVNIPLKYEDGNTGYYALLSKINGGGY